MNRLSLLLSLIFSVLFLFSTSISASAKVKKKKTSLNHTVSKDSTSRSKVYPYLVYLPQKYDSVYNYKWPLIIYLHGRSASGNNLSKVRRYGVPFYMDRGMKLDAIVVAPQCPSGKKWGTGNWFPDFYNELLSKYNIDTSRIYLTGMSMGGFGVWELGIKYPNRFATLMPFCGGYWSPSSILPLKDIPTWFFHGDKDRQVPFQRSAELVDALQKAGSSPKFTVLKGAGHDIHHEFSDERIYQWMLKYHKGDRMLLSDITPRDTIVWKVSTKTKNKTTKSRRKKAR